MKKITLFAFLGCLSLSFPSCQKDEEGLLDSSTTTDRFDQRTSRDNTVLGIYPQLDPILDAIRQKGIEHGLIGDSEQGSPCFNPFEGMTTDDLYALADSIGQEIPEDMEMILRPIQEALPVRTPAEVLAGCDQRLSMATNLQDSLVTIREYWYSSVAVQDPTPLSLAFEETWSYTLNQLIDSLESGVVGTVCGGHSDGLVLLYQHYGFSSYQTGYGIGDPNNMGGDAATLVLGHSGEIYLMSAMFNTSLVDQSGTLLDIRDYYRLIRECKRDSISWTPNMVNGRYYLREYPVLDLNAHTYVWEESTSELRCTSKEGRYLVKAKRTSERYLSKPLFNQEFIDIDLWWRSQIQSVGIVYQYTGPEDVTLLPLYIRAVYGSNNPNGPSSQEMFSVVQEARGY